ncbi:MAG: hypothetical protein QXR63_04740 [Candidatus Bathyarchaeia archaeon]
MKYIIKGEHGELEIRFGALKGSSADITREFLKKLIHRIVIRSTEYYRKVKRLPGGLPDHAFPYREKQFHSIVCPSIADITTCFLAEHPLKRKPAGEEEYPGNVDYWIFYKNYSFMMELKHSYFAYKEAENPSKIIARRFSRALRQLEEIRIEECRSLTFGNGLRKIALETVVFYKSSKEKDKLMIDLKKENFKMLFRKLLRNTELEKRSKFHALWILNRRLIEPFEYSDCFQIYPAVGFIGRVSETFG